MERLSKDERWFVVENLYAKADTNIDEIQDLLDKLAPGWRDADSCQELAEMVKPIHVGEKDE